MDGVRRRADFTGSIEVNLPAARGSVLRIESLEIISGDMTLVEMPLSIILWGDGGWYEQMARDLEKIEPAVSYIYLPRKYHPLDHYRTLSEEELFRLEQECLSRVESAREDPYFLLHPPVDLIRFPVPITEMVSEDEFRPGLVIPMTIRLRYEGVDGGEEILELEHVVTALEPMPQGPQGLYLQGEDELMVQGTWNSGDLHVHDCKDETSIIGERGCPTCFAESVNWGADNSLEEMKSQYNAMGADWFTITSHSYCVEAQNEYNGVDWQAGELSDASFLVIPDTELTSEEEGPQEGGDYFDLFCTPGVNHMGAHWITSWKPGGSDGYLEFCSNPIYGFSSNIQDIRSEGGFGIINHPAASSWGWNSYANTHGFNQPDGFHGVEIWNGPIFSGQLGSVDWWVRKLLDGELMYAYSGSDTHDDVFDFGWNHAFLVGGFNSDKLKEALIKGRVYVSNYQALALLLRDLDTGRRTMMGGGITIGAEADVEVSVYFDFGTKTGDITLFKGVVGENDESVFHQETNLQGTGWLYIQDLSPAPSGTVYYRAYSSVTSGGTYTAYSNPVWVRVLPANGK